MTAGRPVNSDVDREITVANNAPLVSSVWCAHSPVCGWSAFGLSYGRASFTSTYSRSVWKVFDVYAGRLLPRSWAPASSEMGGVMLFAPVVGVSRLAHRRISFVLAFS